MTSEVQIIAERSGAAFSLPRGATLTVIDPCGEQVADLLAYNARDMDEVISSGRTLDYAETIRLTTGHRLYSNRSRAMLTIIDDSVGVHDFLLTPCSIDTFLHFYPDLPPHRGCFGNLAEALGPYGVAPDRIPIAFNCFMNVAVDGESGKLSVLPPVSKAGDRIAFRAEMDLVIGLTACSAPDSNGGSFKPIHYRVEASLQ
ncbi:MULTISPECIES: urea carboxylase-associated family protein [unclassified Sphingomonas]|uniref:urea carboxylase-associated family protein n=1 Tax=unclassified Sphingomonas TaxID=196159 RepID=UPI00092BB51F|nr:MULTISPECIES: urea carboxylase-associated family protein [unclassified Sphingomonas]OJU17840.1 MAG: urea carboxylase-associated protein [Sphingomonas sp. 66-10]